MKRLQPVLAVKLKANALRWYRLTTPKMAPKKFENGSRHSVYICDNSLCKLMVGFAVE